MTGALRHLQTADLTISTFTEFEMSYFWSELYDIAVSKNVESIHFK